MVTLPPHSSHKTQPLDRSLFRPIKAFYDEAVDNWTTSHPGQVVSIYDVAELFAKAFEKSATVEKAVQGFSVTGICPFDRNKFTDDDFLPSEVTDQNVEETMDEDENQLIVFDNDRVMDPDSSNLVSNTHPSQTLDSGLSQLVNTDPYDTLRPGPSHVLAPGSTHLVNTDSSDTLDPVPSDIRDSGQLHTLNPGPSRIQNTGTSHAQDLSSSPVLNTIPPQVFYPGPVLVTDVDSMGKSPRDIIPLPKITKKKKRSKRSLKSTILTSTPNKLLLETIEKEKAEKENKKLEKEKKKVTKKLFQEFKSNPVKNLKSVKNVSVPEESSDESEDNFSVHDSSSDSNFLAQSETECDDGDLEPGDFAVIKVYGKTKSVHRLYVIKVTAHEDDGFDGIFYKRVPQTQKFEETMEESYFTNEDVVLKLSKPVSGSSARFQNMISFKNDLNNFSIF